MRSLEEASAIAGLLSAGAVRARCRMIFDAGLAGRLAHFDLRPDRLDACADYVADTIRINYPTLDVPFHARWRHFAVDGYDAWQALSPTLSVEPTERARQRLELAVISVLLDAGAGPLWRFTWQSGARKIVRGRSEGLALASLAAFAHGLFTSAAGLKSVDAKALRALDKVALARAFDVTPDNPLDGLQGRVGLLNRLGETIIARPDLFGRFRRLGGLHDMLAARAVGGRIAAPAILALLLDALGPIWPGRVTLDGVDLGDTWRHPAIDVPGPTNGLVPFHKLSQWLAYSLIEPLQEAGIDVTDVDGLTGLAEYRNGGLFVDFGVIEPQHVDLLAETFAPGDEAIVEWRALTVSLLDEIAPLVRARLGKSAAEMPLASILEGGTWSAGRRIAAERRPGGPPPIRIVSDGSVF